MQKILYKYLDIKGGELMLANSNLQFTNATQLNDPFDCHPNLIDYSKIPERVRGPIPEDWWRGKEENDALNLRNDSWLCSLSKINDSLLMWSHYCYNHKGICIGLNLDIIMANIPQMFGTMLMEPLVLDVHYQDILERPNLDSGKDLWLYQLQTKAKDWEYEKEVRLVMEEPSAMYAMLSDEQAKRKGPIDWKEVRHYLPLKGESFESIYFGINTDPKKKEKFVEYARTKLNPNIKIYQMAIDDTAFRLKAIPENESTLKN